MPRPLIVTIFLAVFSSALLVANLAVYEVLTIIFAIAGWQLVALALALFVLSASFIAATVLGSYYYNTFTRVYYTFSAVWIGFFVYAFFASALYGLLIDVSGEVLRGAGIALLAAALLASVYGILHAKKLVIKRLNIALKNMPPAWRGRRAVWISDFHLGQLHGPRFARKVVDAVNALSPDIIFIGGDLFDGTKAPDSHVLIASLRDLRAPLGIYFITGNHEELSENSVFIKAVRACGIRVLQDELVDIEGLQLIGVDYLTASDKERFRNILSKLSIDTGKPSILLKHEPKDLDVAQEAGVSLQISGHTHRAQQWPLEYVTRMAYKGFSYGLKTYCLKSSRSMQVYVSSGTGTWGPPLRVGTDCEIVDIHFDAEARPLQQS